MGTDNTGTAAARDNDPPINLLRIPVIQEQLVAGTRLVETGSVLVTKEVTEEQQVVDTVTKHEEIKVERREINQFVETAPAAVRQEGDVTIISVVKEVLVVEKRIMLVEEVHITRHERQEQQTITDTIRKEKITIARSDSDSDVVTVS